jgi:gas vesicle protein
MSAQATEGSRHVYQRAQTVLQRATIVAAVSGTLLRHFMRNNERKMQKNRRKIAHNMRYLQNTAQNTFSSAWSKMQNMLQGSTGATQDILKAGLEAAHNTLQQSTQGAQKKLKHGQKSVQQRIASDWSTVQDSLESGWSAVQDRIVGDSMQLHENLSQVLANTKDAKKALQKRYKRYQHKRAWRRRLFRWGMVSGFLLALLFAPISGMETRKRIGLLWNQYRQYLASGRRNDQAI